MTDDDFWADVFPMPELPEDGPELDVSVSVDPCPECGSTSACAYDAEGRPLIHAIPAEDEFLIDGREPRRLGWLFRDSAERP